MDKDHLIDLITSSFQYERNGTESLRSLSAFKNYLKRLDLEQLRTMSKEFIL